MCYVRDIALHSAQSLDFTKNIYYVCLSKLKLELDLANSTKHMDSVLCDGLDPFIGIKS